MTKSYAVNSNVLLKSRSFDRVFDVQPIDESESREIELMLFENYQPSQVSEDRVGEDFREILTLTAEIRAINKQQVVLIGERVFKVRDVLKNYGDGQNTFTKWIEKVFGSKRTAYNFLKYYEFYNELPSVELKIHLKKMPLKAAYCLSNRQAPIEKKLDIVRNYQGGRVDDLLLTIKTLLPTPEDDKRRKSGNQTMIHKMQQITSTLSKRKEHLSEEDKVEVQKILTSLESFL